MPCTIKGNAIICTRRKISHCHYCGALANLLCDWPQPNGKTCDRPICPKCSTHEGPDKDFCKQHQGER